MEQAYRRTRKNWATGADGQTAEEFSRNLEENLQNLVNRAKVERYRAPAMTRVHIPKGDDGSDVISEDHARVSLRQRELSWTRLTMGMRNRRLLARPDGSSHDNVVLHICR